MWLITDQERSKQERTIHDSYIFYFTYYNNARYSQTFHL